ncbi:MAG: hypothetical protein H6Q33_3603 [Deltaproteobacteria bacterium]|nr:hypothetical protein [Deltaproteobacteria bacterium]
MTRTRGVGVVAAVALIAAISGTAFGDVRRVRPARRPYITEVGQPYAIYAGALDQEIRRISDLRTYVNRYGYPDYAEIQEVVPDWPWQPYEVRLYYLDRDVEAAFGAVNLSPAAPNFGVMKSHGTITREKRREVETVLRSRAQAPSARLAASTDRMEALVSRVEAATERAVQAADRAVADSEAASRAAERTVATVQKMERRGHHRR